VVTVLQTLADGCVTAVRSAYDGRRYGSIAEAKLVTLLTEGRAGITVAQSLSLVALMP